MIIQFSVITLSIAAGLYYLAELVEEYTVMTAKVIKFMIIFLTAIYIGLFLFEDLNYSLIVCGLLSCGAYYLVLQTFPFFTFTSPAFLASIALVFINHYLAFSYFSTVFHPFSEVLAYFTLCLWLVPFAFFVSLSANENVLPTVAEKQQFNEMDSDVVSSYFQRKSKKYGLLSFFKYAQESILPEKIRKNY
ncbi:hypothetical protein ScPMuIL_001349 [Solemya velum]